jgi:hypothetical protein
MSKPVRAVSNKSRRSGGTDHVPGRRLRRPVRSAGGTCSSAGFVFFQRSISGCARVSDRTIHTCSRQPTGSQTFLFRACLHPSSDLVRPPHPAFGHLLPRAYRGRRMWRGEGTSCEHGARNIPSPSRAKQGSTRGKPHGRARSHLPSPPRALHVGEKVAAGRMRGQPASTRNTQP